MNCFDSPQWCNLQRIAERSKNAVITMCSMCSRPLPLKEYICHLELWPMHQCLYLVYVCLKNDSASLTECKHSLLLWAEIIIGLHFNYAICNILKGCGHAELNCPTSLNITAWWPGNSLSQRLHLWFPMRHHVLLLERKWSLKIHHTWSFFSCSTFCL